MDTVTALVAGLLEAVRGLVPGAPCPGGWAWALSVLGVGVGLLPTAGAVAVVVARRRIGSHYGLTTGVLLRGLGLLSAGLLPLLAVTAAGRAVAGGAGLSDAGRADLAQPVCLTASQAEYLAGGTVGGAFDPTRPVTAGLALVAFVVLPVAAALFTAAQVRLALRRGPAWPAKWFWLPVLALPVLTAGAPAGATGHLWLGMVAGSFLGILVLLVLGPPPREVVRRSLEPRRPPQPPRRPAARPAAVPPRTGASPSGAHPASRPAPAHPPQAARPVGTGPGGAAPAVPPPRVPADTGPSLADRLASRFAERDPAPPVVVDPAPAVPPPRPAPTPTRVAPTPAVAGAVPPAARFRLVRRLGSGGFGRVWLAEDARLGHLVALKAATAPDPDTEERIRREARALGAVVHPHCVRVHDLVHAGSDPGLAELSGLVLVMEYVDGASLAEVVRARGVLDDVAAARVWAGVAGALDAAHGRGVLHRDVKPANVVVDPAGLAHLIDFGIARQAGDSTMTVAGFVMGTPDFLAPEVAAGGRATPASDAWQLAATLSYALTGSPPRGVHADAMSGLRAAAVGAPLTHLPRHTAHLPLLRAALATDPARRPGLTVTREALERWLRGRGVRVEGPVAVDLPPHPAAR